MVAYATPPTTAIDVTGSTALNIGIGAGNEIVVEIILCDLILIIY